MKFIPFFFFDFSIHSLFSGNVAKIIPIIFSSLIVAEDPGTSNTRLSISFDAFLVKSEWSKNVVPVNGSVLPVNTHEAFKNLDRKQILSSTAQKVCLIFYKCFAFWMH